jgi:hypothetical protein
MSYRIGDKVAILQSEIPIKHNPLTLLWSKFCLDQTGQRESLKLCNGISGVYAELSFEYVEVRNEVSFPECKA